MLNRTDEATGALQAALELAKQPSAQVEIALEFGALFARTVRIPEAVEAFGRAR